jgi:hypothetical protein
LTLLFWNYPKAAEGNSVGETSNTGGRPGAGSFLKCTHPLDSAIPLLWMCISWALICTMMCIRLFSVRQSETAKDRK